MNVTESISNKLSYFTELEKVANQMNSLSVSRDRKKTLMSTLAKLDECILFIEKNVRIKHNSSLCRYCMLVRQVW